MPMGMKGRFHDANRNLTPSARPEIDTLTGTQRREGGVSARLESGNIVHRRLMPLTFAGVIAMGRAATCSGAVG